MWSEMSYNKFQRNNDNYILDNFDIDNEKFRIYSYGLYEDIYKLSTFGVEDLFDYQEGEY